MCIYVCVCVYLCVCVCVCVCVGMGLVDSLRHYLTNGGFRLPGEAQKIERMLETFAKVCVKNEAGRAAGPLLLLLLLLL